MSALNVVRVKRKATEEPVEALVIALKRTKCDSDDNQVYLKFATTLATETDFNKRGIQALISKDQKQKTDWRKSPKNVQPISSPFKKRREIQMQRQEKRHNILTSRRLILANEADAQDTNKEEKSSCESSYGLFKLYDIIEENEDIKSVQDGEKVPLQSSITCNGQPLIRVKGHEGKVDNYVYDVYIANGNLDDRFVRGAVSVQPASADDLFPDNYSDGDVEEYYEDEDDSNDENNWRNDYPDEDSDFERERDYFKEDDYEYGDIDDHAMVNKFKKFGIDEDRLGHAYASFKASLYEDEEKSDDFDD